METIIKHVCGNCENTFDSGEIVPLEKVPHLASRLDPGSEVPSGECPLCGALVYVSRKPPAGTALVKVMIEVEYQDSELSAQDISAEIDSAVRSAVGGGLFELGKDSPCSWECQIDAKKGELSRDS